MKIVQFTAENIKKLKVVDITPTKDFIQITGKNGSGKTSVLDAIWWALAGKEAIQGKPIREGAEKARIKLNLGDLVVERRFTQSGTTLTVENADGFKASSPQSMLDAIIGHLTFDPLEFSRMEGKKQFDELRKIADVKVDFGALAAADKDDTEKRRDINRDVKNLEGELAGLVVPDDAPDEPVDVDSLMAQLGEIESHNKAVEAGKATERDYKNRVAEIKREIAECEDRLLDLRERLSKGETFIAGLKIPDEQDATEVKAQIAGAQARNLAHFAKKRKATLQEQIAAKQAESDAFTLRLQDRAEDKNNALSESKMPIEGLTFGDGEVLFNGIPFLQLSGAEQLRVSVAIAMAANPKLKIIRIKDGSLLDDEGLKMIQAAAAEKDYQVWCERVDSTGKIGIVMSDGEVSTVNEGE